MVVQGPQVESEGPTDNVDFIEWHPDGLRALVIRGDRAQIWDTAAWALQRDIEGQFRFTVAACWTHDGRLVLATKTFDATIMLVDPECGVIWQRPLSVPFGNDSHRTAGIDRLDLSCTPSNMRVTMCWSVMEWTSGECTNYPGDSRVSHFAYTLADGSSLPFDKVQARAANRSTVKVAIRKQRVRITSGESTVDLDIHLAHGIPKIAVPSPDGRRLLIATDRSRLLGYVLE